MKMISRTFSLVALFALASITITIAHATSQTQISLTGVGNSEIDLAWDEQDRMIRTWAEFSNFNPNDGSFTMKIVQLETNKVVSESTIDVMTTSKDSRINFNSLVLYLVNAEDICQNEEFHKNISSIEECMPLTGEYEMQVSTNDGSTKQSRTFTIIDTRL